MMMAVGISSGFCKKCLKPSHHCICCDEKQNDAVKITRKQDYIITGMNANTSKYKKYILSKNNGGIVIEARLY